MKLKISQIVLVIEKVIVIVIITVLVIVIVIITIFAKVICNCTDYISNVITTGPYPISPTPLSEGRQWGDKRAHNSTTKVSFCTIYYMLVSLHGSDHEGVVRIFVALSCKLRLFIYIIYITRHNFLP